MNSSIGPGEFVEHGIAAETGATRGAPPVWRLQLRLRAAATFVGLLHRGNARSPRFGGGQLGRHLGRVLDSRPWTGLPGLSPGAPWPAKTLPYFVLNWLLYRDQTLSIVRLVLGKSA